ncbi:wax ester synthase/diacylglycerol acyltransferase 4-like [Aristolochia californica]|uniref:wax ester synthase/diacylglycerol acyltransferase 4-like n=1 Tax=Aristolochia californica TaxID=171875 RepID=UPI0035E31DFF
MASDQRHPGVALIEEDEEEHFPASPMSEYLNTNVLSLVILAVFETEVPFNDSQTFPTLTKLFLPINPRFSSILVRDEKGAPQWKKVKVNLEDHVKVPHFPQGLPPETYSDYLHKYLTKIAMEPFPEGRPLWEFHIFKYPTKEAAGTLAFKLHHALGDGFSLMGALFSCLKRADDPSLPLTFPSAARFKNQTEKNIFKRISGAFAGIWNTTSDVAWNVLRSTIVQDDRSAIRSGNPFLGSRFQPITLSSVVLSLDRIREVKSKLAGTINDVVAGTMSYGIQIYTQKMGHISKGKRMTQLVLLNTRMVSGYQSVQEMVEGRSWGNNFTFLHISVPVCENVEEVDPLIFIRKAKETVERKRNSMEVFLVGSLLNMLRKIRGPQAVSRYIYSTLKNTTMTMTNMIGPIEQIEIADHPVKNFYFLVMGSPQSLTATIVSYMGKLTISMVLEEGFIVPHLLVSCVNEAFEKIYDAATRRVNCISNK